MAAATRISYLIDLTGIDTIRVIIFVERPRSVVAFTVQYETIIDGTIYPVVRYDSAHGYPHRDTLDSEARVIDKFWLAGWAIVDALDHAVKDVKTNYRTYRAAFVERMQG
jgi:hypothetical protein